MAPPPPPPRPSRPGHRARALDPAPLDRALASAVPDARERAFVLRCILEEGPAHHRGASYAILRLLSDLVEQLGGAPPAVGPAQPMRMRLPPHLAHDHGDDAYPLALPVEGLRDVLGAESAGQAVEDLSDGPPHHALANAAMVWLIEAARARLSASKP